MDSAVNAGKGSITIVGAGMAGCLMSIYLARSGLEVDIFEQRPDPKKEPRSGGRSINLTIAARGLAALKEVGLEGSVLDLSVPLQGRLVHRSDGKREPQPYGNSAQEVIYSIRRSVLNNALLRAVDREPGVRIHFEHSCVDLDKQHRRLSVRDQSTGRITTLSPGLVIGADGVFSTVRTSMQKGQFANKIQEFLDWGYKELTIPPGPDGRHVMADDVLHIWPQGDGLLLAMPNPDGSFTGTLCLPFKGSTSFESLDTEEALHRFCEEQYPDAVEVLPEMARELGRVPVSGFLTYTTDPWYFDDWVVLLGDACHTVLPFYGQGMNAAFEDCAYLARHLPGATDRERVFQRYQAVRKRHTDTLARLSKENFVELREGVRSPLVGYRKRTDLLLNRLFPKSWIPLYTLISHSTVPYADGLERAERQGRILRWTGVDLMLRGASLVTQVVRSARRLLRRDATKARRGPRRHPTARDQEASKTSERDEARMAMSVLPVFFSPAGLVLAELVGSLVAAA